MRTWLAISLLAGFITFWAGCDAGGSELAAISRGTTNGPPPWDSMYDGSQGVGLEGGPRDGQRLKFDFTSAVDPGGESFDTVSLAGGTGTEIVAIRRGQSFRGAALVGVTFSGEDVDGNSHSATITAYASHPDPHFPQPALSEYRVVLDGNEDLCSPTGVAMPIEGRWTADGRHMFDEPNLFSFACSDGVMFKCIDFGWRPWVDISGPTIGDPTAVSMASGVDLHQTCTRMARADYCADGHSHTLNGTHIHYYDIFNTGLPGVTSGRLPLERQNPIHPFDRRWYFYFEAAWRPGDPTHSAAVCLTKKRWSTIVLSAKPFCPTLLDPRKTFEEAVQFCDDRNEADLEATDGVLLFNDSSFIDRGLYTWSQQPLADTYTTSNYIDYGVRPSTPPLGFFWLPNPNGSTVFEGAVFNYETYLRPAGLLPLCSFQSTTPPRNYLTTVGDDETCLAAPTGFLPTSQPLEGLIYDQNDPALPLDAVPLYLYSGLPMGRFRTTTDPTLPGTRDLLGYLPYKP